MLLGPARIHAGQDLSPILRLGAAGTGVDLDVAVVGVGLAGEQAFQLALRRPRPQRLELRFGLGDRTLVALGLAQLDQGQRVIEFLLERPVGLDGVVEMGALARQLLGRRPVVPEVGVLGLGVQLVEPLQRPIPVKDASAATPGRRGSRRPSFRSPPASRYSLSIGNPG
jgi:hypothetical protein